MTTKTLLSLATVSLLAFAAKADDPTPSYTVETTNSWFSVTAASVDLASSSWGTVKPTREESANVIDVDTDAANPAKYTPGETKPSATRYRITGNMTVTLNAAVPGNDVFGNTPPKAALVAVAGDSNKWYAWHLTAANAGAWVEMAGHTPVENTSYAVAIEFTTNTVSYTVGGTTLGTAASSGTTKTLDNTVAGLDIAAVGLAGYGSFGDFGAVGYEEFEVTVPAGAFTAMDIDTTGMNTAQISAALNEKGTNGLTKWESIVLGLESSSTKPYTAPVQTSDNTLGFTIGNVSTAKYGATGATVTFDVVECDSDGTNEKVIDQGSAKNVAAGGTATVTAPDTVKYYKIKVKITK